MNRIKYLLAWFQRTYFNFNIISLFRRTVMLLAKFILILFVIFLYYSLFFYSNVSIQTMSALDKYIFHKNTLNSKILYSFPNKLSVCELDYINYIIQNMFEIAHPIEFRIREVVPKGEEFGFAKKHRRSIWMHPFVEVCHNSFINSDYRLFTSFTHHSESVIDLISKGRPDDTYQKLYEYRTINKEGNDQKKIQFFQRYFTVMDKNQIKLKDYVDQHFSVLNKLSNCQNTKNTILDEIRGYQKK